MSSLASGECKLISPDEASQIALSRLTEEDLLQNTASALNDMIVNPNARPGVKMVDIKVSLNPVGNMENISLPLRSCSTAVSSLRI